MRRLAITLLFGSVLSIAGSMRAAATQDSTPVSSPAGTTVSSAPASSAPADELPLPDTAPVDVFKTTGLFDDVIIDNIAQMITRSETNGAQALVIQVDTPGAVASKERMIELLERVATAKVPIALWIGETRSAQLYGTPAQLVGVVDAVGMVPGARFGFTGDPLTVGGKPIDFGASAEALRHGAFGFAEARDAGLLKLTTSDQGVPTVRNMVGVLDGLSVDGVVLDTITDMVDSEGRVQPTATLVKINDVGLFDNLMHTVASPAMAYLLFIIGACLLVFEFFTAGVGIAGVIGALCLTLGCYGLAALPIRGWALGMLIAAILAFAVDTQVGIPRFWTGVGIVLFIPASWWLYRDLPGSSLRLPWLTLIVGIVGVLLTFIVGMPSMVRTRFATPTIGREWMIGELGQAVVAIDPNGVAEVSGAKWRARTNRATPIAVGATLRVIGIDGVTLDVEPEQGAARDYRERRGKHADTEADAAATDAADTADTDPS